MSGFVGDLSPKQEQALEQFKKNLKDVMKPEHDDHFMLRWLRARRFDLKKSEKMLRDSLEWRKKFGADTILEDWKPPEVLTKYYPGGFCGHCKEGYPIWIDVLGTIDLKGMAFSTSFKNQVRWRVRNLEWLGNMYIENSAKYPGLAATLYNSLGFYYGVPPKYSVRWKVYNMEKFYQKLGPDLSKQFGKHIGQNNLIFDMEGIGMKHLWKPAIDTFTEILSVFEANYPETLRVCWVINAPTLLPIAYNLCKPFMSEETRDKIQILDSPKIFPIAYNLCKPFLSEDTKKKVKIVGTPGIFPIAYNLAKPFLSEDTKRKIRILDRNWKEVLLKEIDPDQLPKHWGGTATDPDGDPHCRSKVCMGGPIPESYHMTQKNMNVDLSKFTVSTVNRGSSLQLDYEVPEEGCILRWQFWTEGMDIGFGVFRRTADTRQKKDDMGEVVPSERINSHIIPEDGSCVCDKVGTYVFRFDNTYSWVNTKKVSYSIEVLDPDRSGELEITAL